MPSLNSTSLPRSSGAVSSGMYRAGYAARVLVGSVLVACWYLAGIRVLRPACSGLLLGFSVDFGRAKHHLHGRGVFVGGG